MSARAPEQGPAPRAVLRVGIVITAAGAAILVMTGDIIPNVVIFTEPSGQALLGLVSVLVNTIRFVAVPLGCALIAAGLVIRHAWSLHRESHGSAGLDEVP